MAEKNVVNGPDAVERLEECVGKAILHDWSSGTRPMALKLA